MPRHDRSGGRHHAPSSKGKGHQGRGIMKRRRQDSGMSKADFETLLKRLGIQGRQA